jgi:excinuclease ABC subunit C
MVPSRVECLDISNIGGEQAVGSLVCFVNGLKEKRAFRHFKVRTAGPDDFAMIAECVRRHLGRGKVEGTLPDLLVVDGGAGQVSAAWKVIQELGIVGALDLLGIAKGKEGAVDALFLPGNNLPIRLDSHAPELLFLMKIRDEAHRFGISLHRRLRQQHSFSSPLDSVSGIGKVRKQRLLTFFGSLRRIQSATVDELAAVPGIGREQALRIWEEFH